MTEKPVITNEEAVEKMLAFVNRNLVLDMKRVKKSRSRVVITGTGQDDRDYALEIITPSGSGRPITTKHLERVAEEDRRYGKKPHGRRTYRAFILPRSILYWNAPDEFHSPYLRPAADITKLNDMLPHFREYFPQFDYTNSIGLTPAERFLADVHSGKDAMILNYYNVLKDGVQQIGFKRYPADEPIPSNGLWVDGRAYRLFPTHPTASLSADEEYKKTQDELHEKVRIMMVKAVIGQNEKFTLAPHGKGATIVAYNTEQYTRPKQLELMI